MRISIIMATYNSEKTLVQAIQSIINQSYADKELIIIDGQSSDTTMNIIKDYEHYIGFWLSEPDIGVYDAMNKGIAKASGDVIAFLNSDDWYEDGILWKVNDYFVSDNIDILAGKVNHVFGSHVLQEEDSSHNMEDLWIRMIYHHQGMFVKREVFDRIGNFNLKYKLAADYDWELRAYCEGIKFTEVDDIFANYRCDGLSFMQRYKGAKEQKEIALLHAAGSPDLIKKINNYFENQENLLELTLYNQVWKYSANVVRNFCGENTAFYIWGTGDCGKQCCRLFLAVELDIIGFIDNSPREDTCYGYSVLTPEKLSGKEQICIASDRYEEEINKQVTAMGYAKQNILLFSELKDKMISYGRKHYMDYVMN